MRLLLIKKCDLFTSLFFIFISGVSVKSYFQDFMMQKVDFNFSGVNCARPFRARK